MKLIRERWVEPFIDTGAWEHFDLSCKSRDDTKDKVLHDAVASGVAAFLRAALPSSKIAMFPCPPTTTPHLDQHHPAPSQPKCRKRAPTPTISNCKQMPNEFPRARRVSLIHTKLAVGQKL